MLKWIVILLALANIATADESKSKIGIQVEGLGSQDTFVKGFMVGGHFNQYFSNSWSLGLEMNVGSPSGLRLENDNLAYGGATIGYDKVFGRIFHYEANLFVGYGFGSYGKSAVVKPDVGAGLVIVDGYRAIFSVGFIYMPDMPQTTGVIFGIKLDRKTFGSNVWPSSN